MRVDGFWIRRALAIAFAAALLACRHATAQVYDAGQVRAMIDSLAPPPCDSADASVDTAWWPRIERPREGVFFRAPVIALEHEVRQLPGDAVEVLWDNPHVFWVSLISGSTGAMMESGPLLTLVHQFQRNGQPGQRGCSDCYQPVSMCATAVSGRPAWITLLRSEKGGSYLEGLLVERAPEQWIALAAIGHERKDPHRGAVLRSMRLLDR